MSLPLTLADAGVRQRQQTRLFFVVIWCIPAALATLQVTLLGDGEGGRFAWSTALLWQGSIWMLWAFWSQIILTLMARVALNAQRLSPWLATHIAGTACISGLNVVAIAALDHLFGRSGSPDRYLDDVRHVLVNHLDAQVVVYWAVLGAAYMLEYVRRYRERDEVAAALEQALARSQLEALRMQLNPHFLFNALNSVAELMEINVAEAQRMLLRVSDLLRLSLRRATQSLIPVWQEIELVELYLQLARLRYGAGLQVEIAVDPAAVDILVPSFLLQPLVENALKHGLAPGHPDQRIDVTVRRVGQSVELVVADNGTGLDGLLTTSGRFMANPPSVNGLGIGITNTRTRLAMLYDDTFTFHLHNRPDGGCQVTIRLPASAPTRPV